MATFRRLLLLTVGACVWVSGLRAADVPAPAAVIAALPPDFQAPARKWLHGDEKSLRFWQDLSPGDLKRQALLALASEPAAADFILGQLTQEPPATDDLLLNEISTDPFWADHPGTVEALRHLAAVTPDSDLMLGALEAARRVEVKQLREVLTQRLTATAVSGDKSDHPKLAEADETWMLLERGANLPGFHRHPPAVFTVKAPDQPIRLVGFGDFGFGSEAQRQVAGSVAKLNRAQPFDFGITLGDNFYPSGMRSPDDPRWRDWWENLYGGLGITFYPCLGNHEWYSADGTVAEIVYHSPSWRLPAPYYSFIAGPVQFFALDTTEVSAAQVAWLTQAVAASHARWKVVYGHHPIFSPDSNPKSREHMRYLQERIWPIIRGKVDAYLCGHQHAMAHMDTREGVHFFMSGGGGAPLSSVDPKVAHTHFVAAAFGFLTLEADASALRIAIYDANGRAYDGDTIARPPETK